MRTDGLTTVVDGRLDGSGNSVIKIFDFHRLVGWVSSSVCEILKILKFSDFGIFEIFGFWNFQILEFSEK